MKYIFTVGDMQDAFIKGKTNVADYNFYVELNALKKIRDKQAQQIWKGDEE